MEAQLMKVVKKYETETVTKLSVKYGFDAAEALAYLHPAEEEKARGRPEKKKRVVNKEQMVTDVIQSLLADAEKATVVAETAEVIAVAEVAEVIAVEKKKVTKKKATVVAEAAVVVAEVAVAATPEKKKVTKKKAPVVVEEAAPVVTEPTTEKKKVVTKKKSPAPAEEAAAPVVAEPSTEKKKVVTKKKAAVVEEATAVVVVPEPVVVVVAEPVKKVAEPVVEKELEAEAATEEDDDDETTATEWTHEGVVYYKMCDNRCGKDNCSCTGAVYNKETQDCVGTWNGTDLEEPTESDDEE